MIDVVSGEPTPQQTYIGFYIDAGDDCVVVALRPSRCGHMLVRERNIGTGATRVVAAMSTHDGASAEARRHVRERGGALGEATEPILGGRPSDEVVGELMSSHDGWAWRLSTGAQQGGPSARPR